MFIICFCMKTYNKLRLRFPQRHTTHVHTHTHTHTHTHMQRKEGCSYAVLVTLASGGGGSEALEVSVTEPLS